jgi:hypothetical protein
MTQAGEPVRKNTDLVLALAPAIRLASCILENRLMVKAISPGATEEFVHLILGQEYLSIGPCGLQAATAIANNRPGDLWATDIYIRKADVIEIDYRCNERFEWRVCKITIRHRPEH